MLKICWSLIFVARLVRTVCGFAVERAESARLLFVSACERSKELRCTTIAREGGWGKPTDF